jgi:putative ABC transport system permease protein
VRPLDKKILRDLWSLKGQAFAIILVIAGGVATFAMSLSTLGSLLETRDSFYNEYRFAELFISLKRAPVSVAARIAEVPGIDRVEPRVTAMMSVELDGFDDPIAGRLISIPDNGEPLLNNLYLKSGRLVDGARDDEIIIANTFAEAHGLRAGDPIRATINGKRRSFTIVGIAFSPEHLFQIAPGALFPDFERYGVMWASRSVVSSAFDMEGAFNDITATLTRGANEADVIDRVDDILEGYGGLGAYGRDDQLSYSYLTEEFRQLRQMATIFPFIFLSVAAFLLNVVMSRLITIQREQVAILKAFGYDNITIAIHYFKLVLIIVSGGVALGLVCGGWLGLGLSELYMEYYSFPYLHYTLGLDVVFKSGGVSALAALSGTVFALRKVMQMAPAEGMRPAPPICYRETFIERIGLKRHFDQPTRMIMRHIERRPVKSLLSVTGIALAFSIVVVGGVFEGSVDRIIDVQFNQSQRDDMSVAFVEPTSGAALIQLNSLEGVDYGEAYRSVPARIRFGHRSYRTSIEGVASGGDLYRLLDSDLKQVTLPSEGVVLVDYLAETLGVTVGDILIIEVLEGARPVLELPFAGSVKQYLGMGAYMELSALNRVMHEGAVISGVKLKIDEHYKQDIYTEIKGMPRVASVVARKDALRNFYETMADQMLTFSFINTLLAVVIAIGVVYNTARIALSERQRELASLRVMGFTRGEISYILLGELAVLTLAAIPLGVLIGNWLAAFMIAGLQTELFRVPLVLEARVYAFAALVVFVSAIVSALIVRDKLDTLDLVAVLKTKE